MYNNFYKDKTVLVTGNTGFKGSWITAWLVELGAKVIGYSLKPPTKPGLFNILDLEKKIKHINGDIRNYKKLQNVIKKYKPDIIFHMAAQSLVRESYKDPYVTFQTNILGTLNLFEAVRCLKLETSIINITTDKCYENKEQSIGYRETDSLGGYDPYSSSKACSELLTTSYRNSFFNPKEYGKSHKVQLASVRAGNVIGGGDWAVDRIIPDCIRSLIDNKEIYIRNPNAIRPWQHVLEPLSGYLYLGQLLGEGRNQYADAWNFGPNDSEIIRVEDIVKAVIKKWGTGNYKINNNKEPHETSLLKLDITKVKSILGWNPVFNIENIIENTIEWYSIYYNKSNIKEFSTRQINAYYEAASKINNTWCI